MIYWMQLLYARSHMDERKALWGSRKSRVPHCLWTCLLSKVNSKEREVGSTHLISTFESLSPYTYQHGVITTMFNPTTNL
jgi:hypothetical protein